MIVIPQFYFKNGKVMMASGTASPVFSDDPKKAATALKDIGTEGMVCIDLSITPVGPSPNLAAIKMMREQFGLNVYVGGGFKTAKEIEFYVSAGADFVILGTLAYQKPDFLEDVCKRFPGKIAVHIDLRHGKVTIPGYAVATNKTALDYAQSFTKAGVRYILYSDADADGNITEDGVTSLHNFCHEVNSRIFCTSEMNSLQDIERIAKANLPRLEAVVMSRALAENRFDLRSAIALANDIMLSNQNDITLTEM
jgi:phosphoribosylformimino-5-aminoimidazole carboxamide ribotide isomerase